MPNRPIRSNKDPVRERFTIPTFSPPGDFLCIITIETTLSGNIRSTANNANNVIVLPEPLNPVINNNNTNTLSMSENRIMCPCNLRILSPLMMPDWGPAEEYSSCDELMNVGVFARSCHPTWMLMCMATLSKADAY